MIIRFTVKNFRSLRDEISLDFRTTSFDDLSEYYVQEYPALGLRLLKLAMFIGKNASGKTNILLAIEFLRYFILNKSADKDKPTGITPFELDRDKDSCFDLEYVYKDVVYKYSLCLNTHKIIRESLSEATNNGFQLLFERTLKAENGTIEYAYDWSGSGANESLIGNLELTTHTQSILTRLKDYQYSGPMQSAYDWFKNSLAQVVLPKTDLRSWSIDKFLGKNEGKDYKDFYVKQLQNADFIVQDIEVQSKEVPFDSIPMAKILKQMAQESGQELPDTLSDREIYLHHEVSDGSFKLNLTEQSDGTIRFFELCGFLCWAQEKNKIIMIDEIERSMHEDLIEHFIASYLSNARECQFLFTSQNTSILDMHEVISRDAIWITDRGDNGATLLTKISDYEIDNIKSLRKLYRSGAVGGTPNLGLVLKGSIGDE